MNIEEYRLPSFFLLRVLKKRKKVLSFLALSGYFVAETSRKALIEQLQEE